MSRVEVWLLVVSRVRRSSGKTGVRAGHVGVFLVEGLHPEKRVVALVVLGRADLAGDVVAGLEIEAPDLRGRDVDVLAAGRVPDGAQETEPLGHDLQDPLGEDGALLLDVGLENLEDELLLVHLRVPRKV